MKIDRSRYALALPLLAAVFAVAALVLWLAHPLADAVSQRLPGADQAPGAEGASAANPILAGKLIPGNAQPTNLPGSWPQFRGPNRDGISPETTPLARSWAAAGPRQLWAVDCGEGYAGAVVRDGRVYLMDYDYDKKQNALRCLSLADGGEIWRYAYALPVKRNHGMTRTVPALADQFVVAMDPKCHVLCLDAATGELRWGMNLVSEFGATVPQWYAGQCPLMDGNAVILAPGGHDALLAAVELATGKMLWRSPNPHEWKMTHSSVVPMEFGGQRFYVYCAGGGVAAVSAKDGALLWETAAWKISFATVPAPLVLDGGKIFLSGGYGAGSLLLQLEDQGGQAGAENGLEAPARSFWRDPTNAHFPRWPYLWHAAQRAVRLPGPGRQSRLGQPGGGFLRQVSLPAGGRDFFWPDLLRNIPNGTFLPYANCDLDDWTPPADFDWQHRGPVRIVHAPTCAKSKGPMRSWRRSTP